MDAERWEYGSGRVRYGRYSEVSRGVRMRGVVCTESRLMKE